jgi:hypothetical protein
MRHLSFVILLIAMVAFVLAGCSDNPSTPVTPGDQAIAASAAPASLAKKGPIVHSVQGGFWFDDYGNGKKVQNTIAAHQYADGSVDGRYLINAANAYDHQRWYNDYARVIYLRVYDNVEGYEKFAVVGGFEPNGPSKGYYEVWWLAINGPGGKNYTADGLFFSLDSSAVAAVWGLSPADLFAIPGLSPSPPIDAGSLSIK